jgi:protein phosphatase
VLGRRAVETRLIQHITIREEQASAALEGMSRFAANPKWLIYLPPTMAPCETSQEPGWLEHPAEAFAYYRRQGVSRVVCEEKHMGSRAVMIVCRDEQVARRRFGVIGEDLGICYTRTGRRFFDDETLERVLLLRVRAALEASGLWETLHTDWICLDCEILPWSAKAQALLREQYAAVGTASRAALAEVLATLAQAQQCETAGVASQAASLLAYYRERTAMVEHYVQAYRRYCWEVRSMDDLKLAPFHLLATEGAVHV